MAEEVYGSLESLLVLEMSDYSEAHSISRLIGSPPGYVGYQDEDALVTPLRRSPSRVVLLQDFSSANPRVQERLLRVFQDGEIADTRGLKADASHAIFVLTIESEVASRGGAIGFGRRALRRDHELLESIDSALASRLRGHDAQVVVFEGLRDAEGDLGAALLKRRMRAFEESLRAEYEIMLVVPDGIRQDLFCRVRALTDAREVEDLFREVIVVPVTQLLLSGARGPTLTLGESAEAISAPAEREPEPA